MLLTITTTHAPATDLGYLLHKNPARGAQAFELAFGTAHVWYPEATDARCTAALALDIDAVGLVRGSGTLDAYVNDRPYVASSFLSVAIANVFGSALAGRCKERPDLVDREIPLEARLAVVPCKGGETVLRKLFEPLGYRIDFVPHPPRYFTLSLAATKRLSDLLSHLYVLIPVLDDEKHYFVGDAEVEKLLRHGEGWLAAHPERDFIARRYLKHRWSLVRRVLQDEIVEEPEVVDKPSLNDQRIGTVLAVLRQIGARRVLDLGCGEGKLLRALAQDRTFEEIVGLDVSHRALEIAAERADKRVRLLHGSLLYRDRRIEGYDAACVVEVIEHLDEPRLAAFERVVFECAKPRAVVVTTPNAEYNVRYELVGLRHRDHRFEWTRAQFRAWAERIRGYRVRFVPVGPEDPEVGSPTQMAVFER